MIGTRSEAATATSPRVPGLETPGRCAARDNRPMTDARSTGFWPLARRSTAGLSHRAQAGDGSGVT